MSVTIEELLAEIYDLDKRNPRLAAERIVNHLDDLQNDGKFSNCESFLWVVSPSKLSDSSLVSILGITSKNRLGIARRVFHIRALAVVTQRRGQVGAEKLLAKYR